MNPECLRITCSYDEIAQACEFAQNAALQAGSNELEAYHCYLAIDEACTNIVEHGSRVQADAGSCIEVCYAVEDGKLLLTITDDSLAFDPLSLPDPDPTAGIESRASGGWGIYFIKRLMDDVRYTYRDGRNQLVLTKRMEGRVEMPPAQLEEGRLNVLDREDKLAIVQISGRYDAQSVARLSDEIGRLNEMGRSQFIVDLTEVTHLTSGGLKLLVSLWQRLRDRRARMVLASVPPQIHELLDLSGLNLIFVTARSVEEAEARLRN